jgi:hypothetical protein
MRESEVRQELRKRILHVGGEERAVAWFGRNNAPDVLALFSVTSSYYQKQHFLIETKRPLKDATEAQKREHERLREAGFTVLVISDFDELDAFLPARK